MKQDISADSLKDYLLKIYRCKVPFDLYIIDKKLKTKLGVYIVQTHKIRVYSKGRSISAIKKTAIHEYAHHIHETEQGGIHGHGSFRAHGEIFWRIYSALMSEAFKKGLYTDPCIRDIISGPDSLMSNNDCSGEIRDKECKDI